MRAKYLYEQYFKPFKNELPYAKAKIDIRIKESAKLYTNIEKELDTSIN